MTDFTITEEFPKSEIEFDKIFSDQKACYDYLFKQKWPDGFICKKRGHTKFWISKRDLYICTQCEHNHSFTRILSH
jgi:transposase-like zinc ribbon protein